MSLYVQHGYGKGNKIDLAITNGDISGIILSPKAESPEKLLEFAHNTLSTNPDVNIYFDPQFFVCKFQGVINSGKLSQYPYYQSGLTRANLSIPSRIHTFTKSVIDFQTQLEISAYISPTIIIDDFNGRDSQIAISFAFESIDIVSKQKKLFISLCIHESAFRNRDAMEEFLNVISLLDVEGFYIIIERESNISKATDIDPDVLTNIMKFAHSLSAINEYNVIVGYSDLLSIPLAAICNAHFACGWFSNLKIFSENNYRPVDGGRRPRKRYTTGILMSSLLLVPEISTLIHSPLINDIMSDSPYNTRIYPVLNEAEWTDEVSCLHNWHILNHELDMMYANGDISNRLDYLENKINQAKVIYQKIQRVIPLLDSKSNSGHLDMWRAAIESFRNEMGV